MPLVRFPDGTAVEGLAHSERCVQKPSRDFGLYLDPCWAPSWHAETLTWPDHGVPADPLSAGRSICRAFARAQQGQHVEVGCIGGLGRTGTVLACMAILAGVPVADAVPWVRRHYRPCAVETLEQEAWVAWFGDHFSAPFPPQRA